MRDARGNANHSSDGSDHKWLEGDRAERRARGRNYLSAPRLTKSEVERADPDGAGSELEPFRLGETKNHLATTIIISFGSCSMGLDRA